MTAEAKRLMAKGFKLVALHPMSKRPMGDGWNINPAESYDPLAGGWGVLLAVNSLCSIDPDSSERAHDGAARCGIDLEALLAAGVRTSSTRPGSGGRSTFKAPAGVRWLKFASKKHGTVLELRATSQNLQDCLPGTVYKLTSGAGPYRQDYANGRTIDDAPDLPKDFAAWWQRMSDDVEFLRDQQRTFLGADAMLAVSSGDGKLAYASQFRLGFNSSHSVREILEDHGYTETRGRFAPPTATGAPAVRPIPGKVDLWQSDHASDPLFGTFDAWTACVVLVYGGDLTKAEAALQVEGFEDQLPVLNDRPLLPSYKRTKAGDIEATKENVVMGLTRPDVCGFHIRHDIFKGCTMLAYHQTEGWRPLADVDYLELGIRLERDNFKPVSKELIRDAVDYVAALNTFDSAQHWLTALVWDGEPRIERFLPVYLGADATPYTAAVSLYIWTALAGRTMQPGIKCDMVPVLVGPQGARKSTAVAALVPDDEFFTRIDLATTDDNLARQMRGKLAVELDELRGLSTRDADHVKSFVTRTFDEWTPKYRELTVRYSRRSVFFGTSNRDDFLADETGNRRWLPFRCGPCDTDAIERDRIQLWAEARDRFKADGVLYREAERLAECEHAAFAESDDWDNVIRAWLHAPDFGDSTPNGREFLTSGEVLREALNIQNGQQNRIHTSRVKKALMRMGYTYGYAQVKGSKVRGYIAPSLF